MSRIGSGSKVLTDVKSYHSVSKLRDENTSPNQRLLILENHLNCVSLQQDALMPLLSMIEYIPAIQRTDQLVKQMQKQLENSDMGGRNFFNDSNGNSFQRQEQKISKSYCELSDKVFDLGSQIQKMPKSCVIKMSEDNSLLRSFDSKSNELDVRELKKEFQSEFINIYREIGGLRNDIEYLVGMKQKKKIIQQTLNLSKGAVEKPLVMTYLEQELCIENLINYEKSTTQRLREEIELNLHNLDQTTYLKCEDTSQISEKLITLKYQLAASKKKYIISLKRIDNQFQHLDVKQYPFDPQITNLLCNIPQLQNKVNNVVVTIQENLDHLEAQIALVNKLLITKSSKKG